jgi:hypothetical protein
MTQGNFFAYKKTDADDNGYLKIVKMLTTPNKNSDLSHWEKDDKIIFVPKHINSYVEKNYGELRV